MRKRVTKFKIWKILNGVYKKVNEKSFTKTIYTTRAIAGSMTKKSHCIYVIVQFFSSRNVFVWEVTIVSVWKQTQVEIHGHNFVCDPIIRLKV